MATPKEHPILFSGPMVRALLDGRKTQTRRIVKPQPSRLEWFEHQKGWLGSFGVDAGSAANPHRMVPCPYNKPGDRLWVRETWVNLALSGYHPVYVFRAEISKPDIWEGVKWKPSIYMPRAASRITLEITDVRVQRLQNISAEDCLAEGVQIPVSESNHPVIRMTGPFRPADYWPAPWPLIKDRPDLTEILLRGEYASLWESINGPGSWDANPWVWVVEFKRIKL